MLAENEDACCRECTEENFEEMVLSNNIFRYLGVLDGRSASTISSIKDHSRLFFHSPESPSEPRSLRAVLVQSSRVGILLRQDQCIYKILGRTPHLRIFHSMLMLIFMLNCK